MLHLILGILKVIGILLLALFGLLLLAALALLFVPVRYALTGKKKRGAAAVQGKVSWLLGLVSASAGYRDGRLQIRLKALCFTLFRFGKTIIPAGKSPFPEAPGRMEEAAGEPEEPKDLQEESREPQNEPEETVPGLTEESLSSRESRQKELPRDTLEETRNRSRENPPQEPSESVGGERLRGMLSRLRKLWQRICRWAEGLFSLPERLAELPNRIWELFWNGEEKKEELENRLEGLRKTAEPYISQEAAGLYKRIFRRLVYLWKHCAPRRLEGWVRFGTGAPDVTGELTGLLYLILPASAETFEVQPDFTERTLEADVTMKGRIRACHLLWTAFWLWRDKELRKMIRRVKGGN